MQEGEGWWRGLSHVGPEHGIQEGPACSYSSSCSDYLISGSLAICRDYVVKFKI